MLQKMRERTQGIVAGGIVALICVIATWFILDWMFKRMFLGNNMLMAEAGGNNVPEQFEPEAVYMSKPLDTSGIGDDTKRAEITPRTQQPDEEGDHQPSRYPPATTRSENAEALVSARKARTLFEEGVRSELWN